MAHGRSTVNFFLSHRTMYNCTVGVLDQQWKFVFPYCPVWLFSDNESRKVKYFSFCWARRFLSHAKFARFDFMTLNKLWPFCKNCYKRLRITRLPTKNHLRHHHYHRSMLCALCTKLKCSLWKFPCAHKFLQIKLCPLNPFIHCELKLFWCQSIFECHIVLNANRNRNAIIASPEYKLLKFQ